MKFVFVILLFSSLAFAQINEDAVAAPEAPEPVADVKGTYVPPTPVQKARVNEAAKKAKKKKIKKIKKIKAKGAIKTKKTKKSTK